jgi:protease I
MLIFPSKNLILRNTVNLVIPGGRGPSNRRNDEEVKRIVRIFFESQKPVAVICHGLQVLISADVIKGRTLTSYISVKEEILNANGNYRDEEVAIDRNLVSSRHPGDLPYFTKAFLSQLQKWEQNINRTVG